MRCQALPLQALTQVLEQKPTQRAGLPGRDSNPALDQIFRIMSCRRGCSGRISPLRTESATVKWYRPSTLKCRLRSGDILAPPPPNGVEAIQIAGFRLPTESPRALQRSPTPANCQPIETDIPSPLPAGESLLQPRLRRSRHSQGRPHQRKRDSRLSHLNPDQRPCRP